ncbi:MAG: phosphotransferase family protein [Paracoccaceae bacterium]|nr:phosphotransferase family protein [Paracoccaceae bacterium]
MIAGLGIGEAALGAWAEAHVPGFRGLGSVRRFGTGQSNPTFRIEAESGSYVLRAKPQGKLLPKAHQVQREARVMAALAGSGVPVPEVLAVAGDADSPLGRSFFVMRFVSGRVFEDPAMPGLGPDERGTLYRAMAETLAALHAVDPAAVGLSDFGRPGGYFARQAGLWARAYRASVAEPLADMERVEAWLSAHLPEAEPAARLLHGDYRHDNMIFAAGTAEVRALVDWELSTLGPPVADLAYQMAQWRLPHAGVMPGLGGLDRAALGLPDDDAYRAAYAARAGQAVLRDWRYALVFSFFRLAAILAGVARRAADGQGPNPERGVRYGEAVPLLAAMALREARRAGETAGE